jgi:hypothetical protein
MRQRQTGDADTAGGPGRISQKLSAIARAAVYDALRFHLGSSLKTG